MLQSSVQAAASAGVEPPWKKWKPNPSPPSFLSLPDVIILHCLARISKSFPTVLVPRGSSSGCNPRRRKLHLCSSYAPRVPLLVLAVGSDVYALRQGYRPSQAMFVRNRENILWSNAPNMTVARVNPAACVLDGKIYVVGGCGEAAAKSCWGEVFDTKTRTWETLPDPGDELRFSSMIKKLEIIRGKVYVTSNEGEGDSVYDPKTRTWKAIGKRLEGDSRCWVGSLHYSCRRESCMWYDKECKEWKHVKGLSSFNKSCRRGGLIETVQFCPKLLILWDKFAPLRGDCEEKTICCALVAFEKRKNGHVWGKVEWSSPVLTVPSSYLFLRSGGIRT
uniref:FKB95-like N-terminal Kelch domain-containing protein n=1 Tax=Brassica campestris TaxID=3711 RepID=M4CYX8_BRACM